jgi:nuclear pore complex protein Nup155
MITGAQSFTSRMECYKETINALDKMYNTPEGQILGRNLLRAALTQDDYLLRVSVYEWLVRRNLLQSELLQRNDILINNTNAPDGTTLEGYLERIAAANPNDRSVAELLWTMYEKTGRHAAAAKILQIIATGSDENFSLNDRMFCLSRAILCMRSDTVGYAQAIGAFNKELEDQLTVARLQLKLLEQIQATKNNLSPASMSKLQNSLVSLTELFEEYASPLDLWEIQLDAIHISGYQDTNLIQEIWHKFIANELIKTPHGTNRMGLLLQKIETLGNRYERNPNLFPIQFLIRELELQACKEHSEPGQVHQTFLNCGVKAQDIIHAYDQLIRQHDWSWASAGNELHLIDVLAKLLQDLLSNDGILFPSSGQIRRESLTVCVDIITSCLNLLYKNSNPSAQIKVNKFRELNNQYQRLSQLNL